MVILDSKRISELSHKHSLTFRRTEAHSEMKLQRENKLSKSIKNVKPRREKIHILGGQRSKSPRPQKVQQPNTFKGDSSESIVSRLLENIVIKAKSFTIAQKSKFLNTSKSSKITSLLPTEVLPSKTTRKPNQFKHQKLK